MSRLALVPGRRFEPSSERGVNISQEYPGEWALSLTKIRESDIGAKERAISRGLPLKRSHRGHEFPRGEWSFGGGRRILKTKLCSQPPVPLWSDETRNAHVIRQVERGERVRQPLGWKGWSELPDLGAVSTVQSLNDPELLEEYQVFAWSE